MNYVRLGDSGLKVSRLCLGCMTYGDPAWRPWVLKEDEARPFIREALEAGINFFDTANIYSGGESERILGRALRAFARREDVVIATKAYFPIDAQPNSRGLSRKHLLHSVDASLQRLGTDYLDLFVLHRFDTETPIEETADTLDGLVRAGKIRYLGASSLHAWRLMKMLAFQRQHRLAPFISLQSQYNLVTREDEEELIPLCLEEGLGLTPWSPLARGVLAGSGSGGTLAGSGSGGTLRAATDEQAPRWYGGRNEVERTVAAVAEVAAARGVPPAQIALAWLLAKPGVASPLVGMSKPHHLQDALAALDLRLSPEDVAALEAPMAHAVRPDRW
ncbi:aldo/keto reductase [Serratia nematodiphila]|nr:aldo/keto reductase [Serratia nematodiphila]